MNQWTREAKTMMTIARGVLDHIVLIAVEHDRSVRTTLGVLWWSVVS